MYVYWFIDAQALSTEMAICRQLQKQGLNGLLQMPDCYTAAWTSPVATTHRKALKGEKEQGEVYRRN